MPGYMGDKSGMTVHHLAMKKHECKIYYVKKKEQSYFVPDTLDRAIKEGFSPCNHCIGKSS
ncbi:MAG: hypothetical protein OES15_04580 [Nitrosopumilus sp.]|jgi:hypothetical protein|nr:hypothetical protein [Nitrosopumilus sp.]MDH3853072.1 hypothetical protein [Nitrosopumilus sp.]